MQSNCNLFKISQKIWFYFLYTLIIALFSSCVLNKYAPWNAIECDDGNILGKTGNTCYNRWVKKHITPLLLAASNQTGTADGKVNEPTFSVAVGSAATQNVAIASTTTGAEIRYTTDGTDPTCSTGTVYTGAVSISSTSILKAIGCRAGSNPSNITTAVYTINVTVSGDSTAPVVTIHAIVNPYLSSNTGAISSQNIDWSSSKNSSYSVRLGGTSCSTGTES